MIKTYVSTALRQEVHARVKGCCEYCLTPEVTAFAPHEIDHVIAEKHGGLTTSDNLALSCTLCNQHKGSDIASIDPVTGSVEPLYHPRRSKWLENFSLNQAEILPLTAAERVTVRLLQLNRADRLEERQLLLQASILKPLS